MGTVKTEFCCENQYRGGRAERDGCQTVRGTALYVKTGEREQSGGGRNTACREPTDDGPIDRSMETVDKRARALVAAA